VVVHFTPQGKGVWIDMANSWAISVLSGSGGNLSRIASTSFAASSASGASRAQSTAAGLRADRAGAVDEAREFRRALSDAAERHADDQRADLRETRATDRAEREVRAERLHRAQNTPESVPNPPISDDPTVTAADPVVATPDQELSAAPDPVVTPTEANLASTEEITDAVMEAVVGVEMPILLMRPEQRIAAMVDNTGRVERGRPNATQTAQAIQQTLAQKFDALPGANGHDSVAQTSAGAAATRVESGSGSAALPWWMAAGSVDRHAMAMHAALFTPPVDSGMLDAGSATQSLHTNTAQGRVHDGAATTTGRIEVMTTSSTQRTADAEAMGSLLAANRDAAIHTREDAGNNSKALSVNSRQFIDELADNIGRMRVFGRVGSAEQIRLTLEPQDLGVLNVRIRVENDRRIHVMISTESDQVREIISRQMSQLKEALGRSDLNFGEVMVEVNTQDSPNQGGQQRGFHAETDESPAFNWNLLTQPGDAEPEARSSALSSTLLDVPQYLDRAARSVRLIA
jgi:flagellar hook-length control protein FliK